MLNWPFWVAQGWLPYRDIAIVHTPLLILVLEKFYQIFGWSTQTLVLFAWIILLTSAWLVKKIAGWWAAFVFLFLAFSFEGYTVWFETLLTPLLLAVYLLIKRQKIFLAGLFFGLALITKQTVLYAFPAVLFLFWAQRESLRSLLRFCFGVVLVVIFLFLWLARLAVTSDFLHWAVQFVFAKAESSGFLLLPHLKQWVVLGVMFALAFIASRRNRSAFAWMLFTTLFAFPRFGYFHLLPALAFFAVVSASQKKFLLASVIVSLLVFVKTVQFTHPFVDQNALDQTAWLTEHYPGSSLFVLNGPDQLYFLTGKVPAVRPWVPQLPWYFSFYSDQKFLGDLVKASPDVVVFQKYLPQPIDGLGAYQPTGAIAYLQSNYLFIHDFPDGTQIWQRR